jgi:hypothetical protein
MVRRGGRKAGSNAGEMGTPLADLMALLYAKIIDRASGIGAHSELAEHDAHPSQGE